MKKVHHYIELIPTCLLVGAAGVAGGVLLSTNVSADNPAHVNAAVTVPEACTMTSMNNSPHAATLAPSTYSGASGSGYENGIGKTTLTVVCNDYNGFSIYAIGYTGDSYDDANHTKLVGSNTNLAISTAVYSSGDSTSSWSMKVNKVTDGTVAYVPANMSIQNSFDSWHVVPETYTKVVQYKANTGSSATDTTLGAKVETTYAAYIADNQPADTYVGQVKYTMVHPYNASEPLVCKPGGATISTIKCMQDISSANKASVLSSMIEGQQYTLKDKRDGKAYTVSKLKDGNIWMTQNLDLDIDSTRTYTNEDTDLGYNTTTGQYDTASWTPERSTYAYSVTTWDEYETSQSGLNGFVHPLSYDPGELYWDGTTSGNSNRTSSTGISQYHLGNYYNWPAAIAMNDTSSVSSSKVEQSICPAGWTLPRVDTTGSGSFEYLYTQYGWNSSTSTLGNGLMPYQSPLYFNLSASYYGNGLSDLIGENGIGYSGSYWSSWGDYDTAYDSWVYPNGGIYPYYNNWPSYGDSIRCLLR